MVRLCGVDVSRETMERLETFQELLLKWNKQINLVAKSTVSDVWDRHILDSVQILNYVPDAIETWVDVGSGGGLPGVIAAAVLAEKQPEAKTTLIESDQRKAVFLRTAARELSLNVAVLAQRAELADPINANIFSARALMQLDGLLHLSERHMNSTGKMIVLKGKTANEEIVNARQSWKFDVVGHQSMTDNEAKILEIRNIQRATS